MVGILTFFKEDVEKALEEERIRNEAEEAAKEEAVSEIMDEIIKGMENAIPKLNKQEKIKLMQGKKDFLMVKITLSGAFKNSYMVEAMKRLESEENASSDKLAISLETDSGNVNVKLMKRPTEKEGELK